MTSKNYKISYYDLMKKILNNEINAENLKIGIINNDTQEEDFYYFDEQDGDFYYRTNMGTTLLLDDYGDLDLARLEVTVYEDNKSNTTSYKPEYIEAKKAVIKNLENLYINLDIEIDNCQGCMEGLDIAFEELNIYSDLLNQLSCSDNYIETNRSRLVDEWYSKRRQEEEIKKKNKIEALNTVEIGFDLLAAEDTNGKKLVEIIHKINRICQYLQDKIDNREPII